MSFIGTQPGYAYNTITKDTFSGNDSDTAFTLSTPATTNGVEVFVENVQQEPTTAYTVSGTTLTFTAAPVTGTNNIYVVHRNPTVQTLTPPNDIALNVASITTSGAGTFGDGITVDNDGATVATFDRATSDGTIVDLQKDGSSVGSIGVNGSDIYIGESGTALDFNSGSSQILPFSVNAQTNRDDGIDLGGSAARFKNLYLSGGVYLGGTGAANYLDDYEEGTFTSELKGASSSATTPVTTTATYRKIGNLVFASIVFSNVNTTGASGALNITGLPFSAASEVPVNIGAFTGISRSSDEIPYLRVATGTTITGFEFDSSGVASVLNISATTGVFVWVATTYYVI